MKERRKRMLRKSWKSGFSIDNGVAFSSDIKVLNLKFFFLRIIRIKLWHTVDRNILQLRKKARTKLQVSLSPYYHSLTL